MVKEPVLPSIGVIMSDPSSPVYWLARSARSTMAFSGADAYTISNAASVPSSVGSCTTVLRPAGMAKLGGSGYRRRVGGCRRVEDPPAFLPSASTSIGASVHGAGFVRSPFGTRPTMRPRGPRRQRAHAFVYPPTSTSRCAGADVNTHTLPPAPTLATTEFGIV